MGRGNKTLELLAQSVLLVASAWTVASPEERRIMQAAFWQAIERGAMNVAKRSSNVAAKAYQHYKETVSV